MTTGKDLVDVSTFSAVVHVPKTGEDVSAATVEAPFQSLANRTRFAKDAITRLDVADAAYRGSGGVRAFPFVAADPSSSGQWDRTFAPGAWTQIGVGGLNRSLTAHIVLPIGTVITRIDVWVSSSGHGASLPAVLPTWFFYKTTNTGPTQLTTKADAGPVANYDTNHAIQKTGLSITIDDTSYAYTLDLYGEAGANSLANSLQVYMAAVYFTPIV